ncbi:MAG: hypothetical protein IK016_11345 [Lachnospiraceae bacterium]|nr:hypothetical protein [Lachnospiraceae bacterium]
MDKRDMLLEFICQDVISFIIEDEDVDMEEAMDRFYRSKTFSHLQEKENELYRESAGYIYNMYQEECA